MKDIKVLGTGCANSKTTFKLIEETAQALGVQIKLEKVEDIADIAGFGVISTPGIIVDGEVVNAGGVPSKIKIEEWLTGKQACCGCCGKD